MSDYQKEKPQSIQRLFDCIAPKYERGNQLLSFYTYKLWNRKLIRETLQDPERQILLDLCAGTGEITYEYLKKVRKPKTAYLLDFSKEMLGIAEKKRAKVSGDHTLHFLNADACQIPLEPAQVDAITCAYGIRNIVDPDKALEEAFRVLKPGGRIGILELTRPTNPLLRKFHHTYLKWMVPKIGKLITTDEEAYSYLSRSIEHFTDPVVLKEKMERAGFESVELKYLFGGIATLLHGNKAQ